MVAKMNFWYVPAYGIDYLCQVTLCQVYLYQVVSGKYYLANVPGRYSIW